MFDIDLQALAAPLPRAYEFVDGSAYLPHVARVRRARGAEVPDSGTFCRARLEVDDTEHQLIADKLERAMALIDAATPLFGLMIRSFTRRIMVRKSVGLDEPVEHVPLGSEYRPIHTGEQQREDAQRQLYLAHRSVSELGGQLQSQQGKVEAARTRIDRIEGELVQLLETLDAGGRTRRLGVDGANATLGDRRAHDIAIGGVLYSLPMLIGVGRAARDLQRALHAGMRTSDDLHLVDGVCFGGPFELHALASASTPARVRSANVILNPF